MLEDFLLNGLSASLSSSFLFLSSSQSYCSNPFFDFFSEQTFVRQIKKNYLCKRKAAIPQQIIIIVVQINVKCSESL